MSESLHTIPYGVPPETYHMDRFDEHHGIRVLYLSNFVLSKGWHVLLEAAQQVCTRRSDIAFDFYGNVGHDTSASEIIKHFNSTAFSDRIIYHGPAYGSAKQRAFELADIFCFPTFYPMETFGIVNIEAMAAGLPIITTDHANIPEIVIDGQGGILVPKHNASALGEAILDLSGNQNTRKRMGEYNQRRFHERYTVEGFAENWINLIEGLEDEAEIR